MINRKMFKSAVIITAIMLSLTACGKKDVPVSAEPTVSEEESTEESLESSEPAPSPTVEPTTEPEEESLDNTESEVDTTEEQEEISKTENESTGIEIVEELDKTMYAQQNCNARSGDGTNYDKMASVEKGAELHVTGRTSNDWYRVEWGDGVVYISASLLGDTAPAKPSSNGNGNSGSTGNTGTQQPSGGGSTQQPSGGGNDGQPTDQEIQDILDSIGGFGGTDTSTGSGTGWNGV